MFPFSRPSSSLKKPSNSSGISSFSRSREERIRRLLLKPIIPVLDQFPVDPSPLTSAGAVFIQGTTLGGLKSLVEATRVAAPEAVILVHLDLVRGLSSDVAGMEFLCDLCPIDGITTIRHQLAEQGRRRGLIGIARFFLQDTRALERSSAVIAKSELDAVELLPAVAAASVGNTFAHLKTPRIAGGLVRDAATAEAVLASGCHAITSTNPMLWRLNESVS